MGWASLLLGDILFEDEDGLPCELVLLAAGACNVAKRNGLRYGTELPERALASSVRIRRTFENTLLRSQFVLSRVQRMIGDFEHDGLVGQYGCGLSEGGSGGDEAHHNKGRFQGQ